MVPVVPDDTKPAETDQPIDVFDRRPDGTDFVLSPVHQDRAGLVWMIPVLAVAVAVIVLNLLPSLAVVDAPPAPTTRITAATPPALAESPRPTPGPTSRPIHQVGDWPGGQLELDIPRRVSWTTDEPLAVSTGISPDTGLTVSFHSDVTQVRTDVCARPLRFVDVGPTADDLVVALTEQVGGRRVGPIDLVVGGYQARRFLLTVPVGCNDAAEGVTIWRNADGSSYVPLVEGAIDIWVVDVAGRRMVITSDGRGLESGDIIKRDGMLASLRINPDDQVFTEADSADRLFGDVDGIALSVVSPRDWGWERNRTYLSKNAIGPQAAEAMILWTTHPDGHRTVPCRELLDDVGPSVGDLADTWSTAPGTELIQAPARSRVGGLGATYFAVRIRELVADSCAPGFYYSWMDVGGGAFWGGVEPGDNIRVWIVDVAEKRLVIEAATHPDAPPAIVGEIETIVGSLQFESVPR
jgi:hypothetical protein